jgi:hypothetical protein
LSRSPTIIGRGSWASVNAVIALATSSSRTGFGTRGFAPETASTSRRMCSGPVPQQPPTMLTPYSSTNDSNWSRIGTGSSGKIARPPSLRGMPAFGMHDTYFDECCVR